MGEAAKTVRFTSSERLCPATATFSFTRPEGYSFLAGEAFSLTIPTSEGSQTHLFSHAEAPDDPEITILTRLTGSAFKDGLLALAAGDEVTVKGPFGRLVVGPDVQSAICLVGGVGVSPVRSIARDIALSGRSTALTVFDGNVDETCIPFRDEFERLSAQHANLEFVHVLAAASEDWAGERGFITADVVRRHLPATAGRHFYVCGPPAMVDAMRAVVDELEVPIDLRHFELFTGYS